jgi:hypothetical protein
MEDLPPVVEIAWDRRPDAPQEGLREPRIFAVGDDIVECLRKGGRLLWSYKVPWLIWTFHLAKRSGHILAVSEDAHDMAVIDVEPRLTGAFHVRDTGIRDAAITPDGQRLAVLLDSGEVSLLEASCREIWRTRVEGGLSVALSEAGDLVGVGCEGDYSLLDQKGDVLWTRETSGVSVVMSEILSGLQAIVTVGVPGCTVAVLDHNGDIMFSEYRGYDHKALSVSQGSQFVVGYGLEFTDFGIPSAECPYVELFASSDDRVTGYRPVLTRPARVFDLAEDGTLTLAAPDSRIEGWLPDVRKAEDPDLPAWQFTGPCDALAVAGRGVGGPVITVAWDEDARDLAFEETDVGEHTTSPPTLRFCSRCGREYWANEIECTKCRFPLYDGGWCADCRSYHRLPIGDKCPVHGNPLTRGPL